MRLFPLSVIAVASLTVGLLAGMWFGQQRHRYLSARIDLILRIDGLKKLDSGDGAKLRTEYEMHIVGDALVLHNAPSWFKYFKHGSRKVPGDIVEARKEAIKATFQKIGGDSLMDETISQLVDTHLTKQELFIPH